MLASVQWHSSSVFCCYIYLYKMHFFCTYLVYFLLWIKFTFKPSCKDQFYQTMKEANASCLYEKPAQMLAEHYMECFIVIMFNSLLSNANNNEVESIFVHILWLSFTGWEDCTTYCHVLLSCSTVTAVNKGHEVMLYLCHGIFCNTFRNSFQYSSQISLESMRNKLLTIWTRIIQYVFAYYIHYCVCGSDGTYIFKNV